MTVDRSVVMSKKLVGEIIRGRVGGLVSGVVRSAALAAGSVVSWSVVMWEDWSVDWLEG